MIIEDQHGNQYSDNEEPAITLPLRKYVKQMIRWNEYWTASQEEVEEVKACQGWENVVHIEPIGEVFAVYLQEDWKHSVERRMKMQQVANAARTLLCRLDEIRSKILGPLMPPLADQMLKVANMYIELGNSEMLTSMGCTKEDAEWLCKNQHSL